VAQYLGDVIERKYNDGLKDLGRKLWRGLVQVIESDFGKGALVTAGIVVGAMAISGAMGIGISAGIAKAVGFLVHPLGWLTLTIGGMMGNVIGAHKEPKKLSVAQAETMAKEYGIGRQPGMEQQQAPEFAGDDMTQNRWRAAESNCRARNANNQFQAV